MSKKMLIDASHSEETRVAMVEGNRVEEFDFESAAKKPIRGNIYLAKVTRVEPSLQAAFVDYGGNRHGFLAFNEIHPDYYQIPHEDRLELQAEEEKAVEQALAEAEEAEGDEDGENGEDDTDAEVEAVARKRRQFFRKYKIQEVIKRRQILLVQVAKEERGNKGAALTTYLSLAGRYCVLMPNTPRGGGISRKISNGKDRKRLKEIVSGLELPTGMGLIVRTAGATRTKAEIRRDHDYLRRVWEDIRDKTLESIAPSLVYEEGDLVRRAIRDMYDRDVEIVLVEGDAGYKEAKGFMKLLMPSHASKVQQYKEPMPLFVRHHVEDQLEAAYNEQTQLKSGGYLVIHQTEALVAIDVNSGRSTRERNIEDTALKTNLEAADEAARQMRLRDLAGLVVIDFIDMEDNRNVRAVEKRMKDALKKDRARLQMGRISQFGLMELSRQRRRTSILEGSTKVCPHCGGKGYVRTSSSSSLVALRAMEEEGARNRARRIRINVPTDVALYLLNEKREHVLSIEQRYDMRIMISADPDLIPPDFKVEILTGKSGGEEAAEPVEMAPVQQTDEPAEQGSGNRRRRRRRRRKDEDANTEADVSEASEDTDAEASTDEESEDGAPRKRRRRGRRGGRGRRRNRPDSAENAENPAETAEASAEDAEPAAMAVIDPEAEAKSDAEPDAEKPKRRSRRKKAEAEPAAEQAAETSESTEAAEQEAKPKRRTRRKKADADSSETAAETVEDKPRRRRTRKKPADSAPESEANEANAETASEEAEEKPKRTRRKKAETAKTADKDGADTSSDSAAALPESASEAPDESDKPKRTGWWQKGSKLFGG
ncbi:Rne/Rng family ribonuclease [Hyphobacterium sp.]|uniref:Rne/Rng family ribonuclease n=1 Tax=Hyphobacterium sp. TaxID=2004662 RepID=UPI003BA8D149